MTTRSYQVLVSLLLFAAVAEFAVRGPLRMVREGWYWNDFLSPYIQARAWTLGQNPYDAKTLIELWPKDNPRPAFVDRDAAKGVLAAKRGIPSPYPPTTLLLLSPFARLPWAFALSFWMLFNVALIITSFLGLISISAIDWRGLRAEIFLAACFALAPIQTGLALGNPAILATSLAVGVVWTAKSGRPLVSGLLLALAICLKPPLGLGLGLYYLVRSHWKIISIAAAATILTALAAALRLQLAGVTWLPAYRQNVAAMFAPGAPDDFSRINPIRFNLINLQVVFSNILANRSLVNTLSWSVGAVLAAVWLWICIKRRHHDLLEISSILVIGLLPVYHRFYDAALLAWPLCWSLLASRKRSLVFLTIAGMSPFFIPGAALLDSLNHSGRLSPALTGRWWWNAIVMPHEVWSALFLCVLLLYSMAAFNDESSSGNLACAAPRPD
jgi:hypothetical protein